MEIKLTINEKKIKGTIIGCKLLGKGLVELEIVFPSYYRDEVLTTGGILLEVKPDNTILRIVVKLKNIKELMKEFL